MVCAVAAVDEGVGEGAEKVEDEQNGTNRRVDGNSGNAAQWCSGWKIWRPCMLLLLLGGHFEWSGLAVSTWIFGDDEPNDCVLLFSDVDKTFTDSF